MTVVVFITNVFLTALHFRILEKYNCSTYDTVSKVSLILNKKSFIFRCKEQYIVKNADKMFSEGEKSITDFSPTLIIKWRIVVIVPYNSITSANHYFVYNNGQGNERY